ncbi:MAG: NAD(P)-binding domain-containing protein, partial [Azonexus sp.]|nr:NAD(P)-binding domain-containing protein [Azonexus sp.]
MSAPAKLGFIGVGDMGAPIARRLLRAGFALTVHDTNPDAAARLAASGAQVAGSAREVASAAPIVFACLPSPAISERVALGDDGVAHGTAVRQYIEMSTIGAPAMERIDAGLRARGIALLDAPVSGG